MREIRLSGSEGGEAETTGLPYPYRPAHGQRPGEGNARHFCCAVGPTGQKFALPRGGPLARWAGTKSSFSRSPGRCPGLGERLALWAEIDCFSKIEHSGTRFPDDPKI